jgi:uncharacterized protein DUF2795
MSRIYRPGTGSRAAFGRVSSVFQGENPGCMEPAAAAQLKSLLVGVALPARKAELLEYAVQRHVEPFLLGSLRTLSDGREYESLDDVVEELTRLP